jgi:hypothetical protein
MHFKFITTAAALLPIVTTLCAAGPLPAPHLTRMELEASHKGEPDGLTETSFLRGHGGAPPLSEKRRERFEIKREALMEKSNGRGNKCYEEGMSKENRDRCIIEKDRHSIIWPIEDMLWFLPPI